MSNLRVKARRDFIDYLGNDYFAFLDRREYLDSESYELYLDPVYDDYGAEKLACNCICYFDGKRVDFSSLEEAYAFSVSYFYDYCLSLFNDSFVSLIDSGIFSSFSFFVYDVTSKDSSLFPDSIFHSNFVSEIDEWLKLSPGFKKCLQFCFYTDYNFSNYWKVYDSSLNSVVMLFRDYLFFEVSMDNVDLSDFDFVFDFLRLQERLTGYHEGVVGYNIFDIRIEKVKW